MDSSHLTAHLYCSFRHIIIINAVPLEVNLQLLWEGIHLQILTSESPKPAVLEVLKTAQPSIPQQHFVSSSSPPPASSPSLIDPANMDLEKIDVVDDQPSTMDKTTLKPSPFYTEFNTGAAEIFQEKGQTFLDIFVEDEHAEKRKENPYYPLATQQEWELASFLLKSDLSMAAIDEFFEAATGMQCTLLICISVS